MAIDNIFCSTQKLLGARGNAALTQSVLELLRLSLRILRGNRDVLLPALADNWAPLVCRARDTAFRQQTDVVKVQTLI